MRPAMTRESARAAWGPEAKARIQELATAIRRNALVAIHAAGSGHPGGSLSAAEVLAVLFGHELRRDAHDPLHPLRDRFVLSKGHACPALYGVAAELGWIERPALRGLRALGSPLQGHPCVGRLPWVEASTGSLGQGFSIAVGTALGLRHRRQDARVHVLLGDGELQEGEIWEGAMCAAHHGLANLCATLDYNGLQSDDRNANVMGLEPVADKWRAFGWAVHEVDGHRPGALVAAYEAACRTEDRPTIVVAHTRKGRGVSYMEDVAPWHGSVKLSDGDLGRALADLGVAAAEIPRYLDGTIWG
jgi:transketolase